MLRLRVGNMTCGDWTESVDAPLKKAGMEAGTQLQCHSTTPGGR